MAKQKRLDLILGAKDRATSVLGRVSGAIGGFVGRVASLAGPLAAVLSVAGVVRFGQRSVQAFFEQEQAVENLRTALINAGDAGARSLAGMEQFASSIQKVTTQGDEATLKLAAYIASIGELTGGQLQDATKATLGLARATGQGSEMMGRAYLNALEGNFSMLERYIPALRSTTDETEKMRLVQQLAANGFKLMESDANTARGRLQQMRNSVGDLMEQIGARLAPTLGVVAGSIRTFAEENGERIGAFVGRVVQLGQGLIAAVVPIVQRGVGVISNLVQFWFDHYVPIIITYAGTIVTVIRGVVDMVSMGVQAVMGFIGSLLPSIDSVGAVVERVKAGVQLALFAIEFGFKNWEQVIELATLKAGLAVVSFGGQVRHFFGEVIPTTLTWLGQNWQEILTDIGNLTLSVFKNIGTNIIDFFTSIPALISGEKSFADIWTPLTEGFEATVSAFPDIVARQQGPLEQALREQVTGLEQSLGDQFGDYVDQRMNEIADKHKRLKDFFDFSGGTAAPLQIEAPGVGPGGLPKPAGDEPVKVEVDGEAARRSIARQSVGVDALTVTRRFLGLGSRGEELEPAKKTAKNTDQILRAVAGLVPSLAGVAAALENKGEPGDGVVRAVRVEG